MLVTFKSKAAADVLMYEEHAKRILDLLHKDVSKGILTAAELPDAIARLEAEIAESKKHPELEATQRDSDTRDGDADDDNEQERAKTVSFSTRAYPLLEMMRAAQRDNRDVMWGV
ncbi:DUF1840 domain-containing protein [Noviherbaspirillum cavernae]|uniref:DUF1840 domain-containing protein n=1 Tax=Noviherbaspirillum cavernae TaxID=2320862 RepID=A0A418WX60_9BURK|nr:DUF1840 domain-containing protein [Noviherbaspirillum cavernae]RJG04814.1 DUF1840 domain-containing protein [Noviherbaspirillum cavernae]